MNIWHICFALLQREMRLLMMVLSGAAKAVKFGTTMSGTDMKGGENSIISSKMLSLIFVPTTLTQ
jgi:hypothetical protein